MYKAESFWLNIFGMVHFPSLTVNIKSNHPGETLSYILLGVDLQMALKYCSDIMVKWC